MPENARKGEIVRSNKNRGLLEYQQIKDRK